MTRRFDANPWVLLSPHSLQIIPNVDLVCGIVRFWCTAHQSMGVRRRMGVLEVAHIKMARALEQNIRRKSTGFFTSKGEQFKKN